MYSSKGIIKNTTEYMQYACCISVVFLQENKAIPRSEYTGLHEIIV